VTRTHTIEGLRRQIQELRAHGGSSDEALKQILLAD